jgi:hypothetical protein
MTKNKEKLLSVPVTSTVNLSGMAERVFRLFIVLIRFFFLGRMLHRTALHTITLV